MQDTRVKHRSASLAAWINCLAPGLGLYYLGQSRQARFFLLLAVLPWFLLLLLPWGRYPWLVAAAVLFSGLILLVCMIHCWRQAKAVTPMVLLPSQRWSSYGLFWLSFVLLSVLWLGLLVMKLGVVPYQVAGNSMAGNINKYDWVLIESNPPQWQRGDVVLFNHPGTGQAVLQRIAGLPGERITVHGGGLFVDGRWQAEPYIDDLLNQKKIPEGVVETTVPAGQVFVLADNRDHSRDSRYWGALPAERIRGKVIYHLSWQQLNWRRLVSALSSQGFTISGK